MKRAPGTQAARLAAALALLLPAAPLLGQEAFRLGDILAEPGRARSGRLEVAASGDDAGTFIPLTIVC